MVRTPGISCILKHIEVNVISNSKTYKISTDRIGTYEMKYQRNSPILFGFLIFSDIKDLISNIDIKNAKVEIYFNDIFNKTFYRFFNVLDVVESYDKMKNKSFMFYLVDEISYALSNLYISKSFNVSRVSALKTILSENNISSLISNSKLVQFFEDDNNSESFVIPNGTSVLDFFIKEFSRLGYSFYQTRNSFCVRNFDNIIPTKLDKISSVFTYNSKQTYKNLIYEFKNTPMSGSAVLDSPNIKTYYFDMETKQMVSHNETFNDVKSQTSLNSNPVAYQKTAGNAVAFQNRSDSASHINNLREQSLQTFKIDIIINGYMNNDINKIFNIELPGHKVNSKGAFEGNKATNGNYVSLIVIDKLIGDKLLQKVTLGRSDVEK